MRQRTRRALAPALLVGLAVLAAGIIAVRAQPGETPPGGAKPADPHAGHDHAKPPKGHAVTGRLLFAAGQPVAHVPVVLRRAGGRGRGFQAISGEDGSFRLVGAGKGRYRLFEIRVYRNAKLGLCEVLARRDVTVGDADVNLGRLTLVKRTIPPVRP